MAHVDNREISRAEIEEVRRLNPVDDVIREYGIDLRPEGVRLKGLCPFHPDANHPNLTVSPDRLAWKCFRCQAGGDVIEFVRQKENLRFPQAYEKLRQRCHGSARSGGAQRQAPGPPSPIHASAGAVRPARKPWDRLSLPEQVVMNTARSVYEEGLWQNRRALAYVRERGLPDWTIRHCGIGYADGHSLELYLRRHDGLRIAEQLGLLRPARSGTGCRELLAGRVVVPELRGGQCIWFIGRSMDQAGDGPKYVALPGERPVLGLERAAGRREAFVCEGVFDYLTAVVWRLAACSFCGTRLPDDRLGFLAGAEVIYGLFDPDAAGQEGAAHACQQLGERFRPIRLPDGCDLNDLGCRPDGRAAFFQLLAEARASGRRDAGRSAACRPRTSSTREDMYAHSV
jgi:DNA primase